MMLLPESPRYLLYREKLPEARKSLARLMTRAENSPEVDAEIAEISLVRLYQRYLPRGQALTPLPYPPGS